MTKPHNAPIWQKGSVSLDARVQQFCAGDDVVADREFFLSDVTCSRAHAHGLQRIGILTPAETQELDGALSDLAQAYREGAFVLDARHEDGQSAIEAYLIERLGDVGRKIHTGRSRNDQVLVAVRHWLQQRLLEVANGAAAAARALLNAAHSQPDVPMPGYTHLQAAMPTSLAAWHAGHAECFIDSLAACRAWLPLLSASPLGTGSGFGVNLPLDRDGAARELGFERVIVTAQAAQTGRGKFEWMALTCAHLVALDVRRLAWDLSLFFMQGHRFVNLPDAFTTGSSLMPNKRNPDVVELLRALPAVVEGALAELQALQSLPSSYHRDLQGTKAPLVRALGRVIAGVELIPTLVSALTWDHARMAAAITDDMYATDRAIELAASGVPFRDAYVRAGTEPAALVGRVPKQSLDARVSLGGAGNLGLDRLAARLAALATE